MRSCGTPGRLSVECLEGIADVSITIKDIARELSLSYSSVSRALNNKPGVSEETRKKIVKAAKQLGYRPNIIARGLVSKITGTIGVIFPEIVNPIFGEIMTGIFATADEHQYDIYLGISNWQTDQEEKLLDGFADKRVDGILVKSTDDSHRNLDKHADAPIVCFESWPDDVNHSSVSTDNFQCGYIAANHLLDCGYRNTAIVAGPKNSSAMHARYQGVLKAYSEHQVQFDDSRRYEGEYNIGSGYRLANHALNDHPEIDSIIAGNDVVALGVLKSLAENRRVPGDEIGVIGFDDIELAGLPQIQLTTVRQPAASIGRIVMQLLLDEISNRRKGIHTAPQRIFLAPSLVERQTTRKRG